MANVKININSSNNTAVIQRDYLYRDLNTNLLKNDNKTDIKTNDDITAIFGSLQNLFSYTPGERMLEPEFGMDFRKILYSQMNEKTANALGVYVYNKIKEWETRINISSIDITPDYDDNTYYITVYFTVKGIKTEKDIEFTYSLSKFY